VLFADIVGFTPFAERATAERVVAVLDEVFSRFDAVVGRFGLEKIKTIGDAYLAVAGLPEPRADHAEAAAEAALAMRDECADCAARAEIALELRIGMHSGPVVAGVIGRKKFAYDPWGDTVKVASRMEAHGIPGAIQMTAATAERLSDQYVLGRRERVVVKGKGEVSAYLLLGRRGDLALARGGATHASGP
jgi:class 3 adenylate cyclase